MSLLTLKRLNLQRSPSHSVIKSAEDIRYLLQDNIHRCQVATTSCSISCIILTPIKLQAVDTISLLRVSFVTVTADTLYD